MKRLFWIFLIFSYPLIADIQSRLTLIIFQDTFQLYPDVDGNGGLAEIMTLLEKERKKAKNSFTLLNGKFLSPVYFSEFDQAKHMIDLLNHMKIDGVIFQDPCFGYGYDTCMERKKNSLFKWLGANLIDSNHQLIGDPCPFVIEVDQVKIGIVALSQLDLSEDTSYNVYCLDPFIVMKNSLQKFHVQNVDAVVVFSNMNRKENTRLIQKYPEIDVLISSKGSYPLGWYEGETFFYETGENHPHVETIELICRKTISPQNVEVEVYPCWKMLYNKKIQGHSALVHKIEDYKQKYTAHLTQKIQFLLQQFAEKKILDIKKLLSEALKAHYQMDFVLFSSDISLSDLFAYQVSLIELKGSDILQHMESDQNLYAYQARSSIDPDRSYRVIMVSKTRSSFSSFTRLGEIFKDYLEKNKNKLHQWLRK